MAALRWLAYGSSLLPGGRGHIAQQASIGGAGV
jgi:hypothetical protein